MLSVARCLAGVPDGTPDLLQRGWPGSTIDPGGSRRPEAAMILSRPLVSARWWVSARSSVPASVASVMAVALALPAGGAGQLPDPPLPSSPFAGTWKGDLDAGGSSIALVFRLSLGEGGLVGVIDSPDQGAFDIAISSVRTRGNPEGGDSIVIESQAVQGSFAGTLATDGRSITGEWTQGVSIPLTLVKEPEGAVRLRGLPSRSSKRAGTPSSCQDRAPRLLIRACSSFADTHGMASDNPSWSVTAPLAPAASSAEWVRFPANRFCSSTLRPRAGL